MVAATLPHAKSNAESSFRIVESSRLRVGSRLKFPIHDGRDILLLAEGLTITATFLDRLKQRGVVTVKVHESEVPRLCAGEPQGTATSAPESHPGRVCPLENEGTEQLDAEIGRGNLGLPPQGAAFAGELQKHGAAGYDQGVREEFAERQARSVGKIEQVLKSLSAGRGLELGTLSSLTDEALNDMARDSDLFACLGINPFADGYPARHGLHVCMLALSIGAKLQLDRPTLKELAIGCLIHDAGMLRIDPRVFSSKKRITDVEFLEITKHPVVVFDMMKDMRAVSARSAFIAYQMHERCDGSGYPRRRKETQIHFLSKIAAAADVYVGLASPRSHRPALLPYYAVETLLQQVKQHKLDSTAVRALLQTISLFPLGSYVQLSDGRVGRVIRTNGNEFTSPVIEAWRADKLHGEPEIVNLAESDVRVIGPLPSLEAAGQTISVVSPESATEKSGELVTPNPASLRRHERRIFQNPIHVFARGTDQVSPAEPPCEATSIDISQGGLGFICRCVLPSETIVVNLKPGEDGQCFLCKVANSRRLANGAWAYGVAFLQRVPAAHHAVRVPQGNLQALIDGWE